jgi:hypothetical protein
LELASRLAVPSCRWHRPRCCIGSACGRGERAKRVEPQRGWGPSSDGRLPPRKDPGGGGKAKGRRAKRIKRMGVGSSRDGRLPPRKDPGGGGKAKGRRAKRVKRAGVGPRAH